MQVTIKYVREPLHQRQVGDQVLSEFERQLLKSNGYLVAYATSARAILEGAHSASCPLEEVPFDWKLDFKKVGGVIKTLDYQTISPAADFYHFLPHPLVNLHFLPPPIHGKVIRVTSNQPERASKTFQTSFVTPVSVESTANLGPNWLMRLFSSTT